MEHNVNETVNVNVDVKINVRKREPVSVLVDNVNISVRRKLIRKQEVHSVQLVISYYTFFISASLERKQPNDDVLLHTERGSYNFMLKISYD